MGGRTAAAWSAFRRNIVGSPMIPVLVRWQRRFYGGVGVRSSAGPSELIDGILVDAARDWHRPNY